MVGYHRRLDALDQVFQPAQIIVLAAFRRSDRQRHAVQRHRIVFARTHQRGKGTPDRIVGATMAVENGEIIPAPAIELGKIRMVDPGVTFADVYIFKQWRLTGEPAILIGMDALGVLDTLIIDYREHELQLRPGKSG